MTQTIETIPAGIVQQPEPCWELVYADNGEEWDDGDDIPHFTSKGEVDAFVANLDRVGQRALKARQLDGRCWTATAACGLPFEDEGGAWPHWTAAGEALREVRGYDWSVRDGVLRCEDGDACRPVRPLRCRTSEVGYHPPATVLVDGEPRCDSCADAIAGDDPSRRAPLPGAVA